MVRACSARIRNDTSAGAVGAVDDAGDPLGGLDQRDEHVGVEDRLDALEGHEVAFEARAGVDARPRQGRPARRPAGRTA